MGLQLGDGLICGAASSETGIRQIGSVTSGPLIMAERAYRLLRPATIPLPVPQAATIC